MRVSRDALANELKQIAEAFETMKPFFDPVELGALLGQPVEITVLDANTPVAASGAVLDGNMLKVPCPHCGQENQLNKNLFV